MPTGARALCPLGAFVVHEILSQFSAWLVCVLRASRQVLGQCPAPLAAVSRVGVAAQVPGLRGSERTCVNVALQGEARSLGLC